MCLSIPARVVEIDGNTAKVDLGGMLREISTDLCPDVAPGEYVLVHAGFAIQKVDEGEARRTLDLLRELADSYETYR
jgi:hydrogenase expression/formation protein HypC